MFFFHFKKKPKRDQTLIFYNLVVFAFISLQTRINYILEKWYVKKGKETNPVLIKYNKVVGGRTWFGFLVSGVDCRLQVSPLGSWFLRVPPCTQDQSILSSLPLYLRRDGSVNPRISGKWSSFPFLSGTIIQFTLCIQGLHINNRLQRYLVLKIGIQGEYSVLSELQG